jgi:hypothetical protein
VKQRVEQFKQDEESKKTPSTKNITTKVNPPGTPSANKGKEIAKAGTFGKVAGTTEPKT